MSTAAYPSHRQPFDAIGSALAEAEGVAADAFAMRALWSRRVMQLQAEGYTRRQAWRRAEQDTYGRVTEPVVV